MDIAINTVKSRLQEQFCLLVQVMPKKTGACIAWRIQMSSRGSTIVNPAAAATAAVCDTGV